MKIPLFTHTHIDQDLYIQWTTRDQVETLSCMQLNYKKTAIYIYKTMLILYNSK